MTATLTKYTDPGVYRDAHRSTCILVGSDGRQVKYIEMSVTSFEVKRMALPGFEANYEPMPDYAPGRAARLYLATAETSKIPITREAEGLLSAIADAKFDRAATFSAPDTTNPEEEPAMAEDSSKPKKNPAPAKKAAPAAAEKPAAKKTAAATPAKKAAPAAKKAEAAEPGARGRAPNISGDAVITVLVKENPKRGGAAERFALYKPGMTVDQYIAAGGKRADVNWDVSMEFIKVKEPK